MTSTTTILVVFISCSGSWGSWGLLGSGKERQDEAIGIFTIDKSVQREYVY